MPCKPFDPAILTVSVQPNQDRPAGAKTQRKLIIIRRHIACLLLCLFAAGSGMASGSRRPLVLMSDFGVSERFVASMKGVALSVDADLQVQDLTHQIEPFDIWQASYLLAGTIDYWPQGTVFVAVVDPGVGTQRRSVVAQTRTGHFIVTPDNGSLTLVADTQGILALRQIDETVNRRPGSANSHTFHGRDVYAYTGARLAAGLITFEQVGPVLASAIVRFDYQQAKTLGDDTVIGNITHIEMPFGNVVTNIPQSLLDELQLAPQGHATVRVEITQAGAPVFQQEIPYVPAFGFVDEGRPLLYPDSLQIIGLAVNSGNFASQYGIKAGADWTIKVSTQRANGAGLSSPAQN